MTEQLHFAPDHTVGKDAVRCRPADADGVAIASTWQPAYAGPAPVSRYAKPVSRNGYRVTLRRRLADAFENAAIGLACWLDARGRRRH